MKIYAYKLLLDNGDVCYAVGQVDHSESLDIEHVAQSQPLDVPDNASLDAIVKYIKGCVAQGFTGDLH